MSNFKGTNNFKLTRFAFYERLRFKLDAYDGVEHTNLKNLNFSDLSLYGKVNQQYDTIYLIEDNLSTIKNTGKLAISFVTTAFNEVAEHFKVANSLEQISNNEKYLTNLTCYDAYKSPIALYATYIDEAFSVFNRRFLKNKRILNFKDYVSNIIPYAKKVGPTHPLTFSYWMRSKKCPPNVSGLVINVSNINHGNDTLKEKDFINSPNFDFYLSTCKSKGFYVTKQNPSVLVADINSQQMSNFMLQGNNDDYFGMYQLSYKRDIEFLSSKIIEHYGNYIQNRQVIIDSKVSRDNKSYIKINYINNNYNINNINNNIYNIYTNIRNIEEDYVFGQAEINQFIKNAKKIEKSFDKDRAIDYINIKFRSTYASKYGGLNYYNKKFESMED